MASGTASLDDSYWLSQSTVFKGRVQSSLLTYCNYINTETITGNSGSMPLAIHILRKNFSSMVLNPGNFANWLVIFTMLCSIDATVISDATQATTNYTPITTQADGDTAAGGTNIPDTAINNALAAAINSAIPGI